MRAGPVEGIDLASGDHEARSSFAPRRADLPKRKWEDECTDVSGSSMSTPPRESPERECTEESNEVFGHERVRRRGVFGSDSSLPVLGVVEVASVGASRGGRMDGLVEKEVREALAPIRGVHVAALEAGEDGRTAVARRAVQRDGRACEVRGAIRRP